MAHGECTHASGELNPKTYQGWPYSLGSEIWIDSGYLRALEKK